MTGISRESERMSVLVEDLLLLARLDEGRPLEREPVELDEVVAEAVETARTLEPERPLDARARAGDRARRPRPPAPGRRQPALERARAHAAGRARRMSASRRANGRAVLEVADTGPGLDDEQVGARLRALLPRRPVARARERRRRPRPLDRGRGRRRARRRASRRVRSRARARRSASSCRSPRPGSVLAMGRFAFPGRDDEARRNVRRVSIAKLISQAGSGAAWIALVAIVYDRTDGSGVWLAAALVGSFAVRAIAGPWVGVLGDRYDRRAVMVVSDLAAAAAFVGLAFADAPIALVALASVAALAEESFGPAANAQLVMLVPEEQRAWATATRSAAIGAGLVIGGIAGGALVAVFGAPTAFLVNAASFAVSAVLVLRVTGGRTRGAFRRARARGCVGGRPHRRARAGTTADGGERRARPARHGDDEHGRVPVVRRPRQRLVRLRHRRGGWGLGLSSARAVRATATTPRPSGGS